MFLLSNGAEVVQSRLWMSTLLMVYKAFLSEPSSEWFFTDGLKHPGVPSGRRTCWDELPTSGQKKKSLFLKMRESRVPQ